MPSLPEIQAALATALFDGADDGAARLLRNDGIDAPERIAIYRNNLREGFRKALALEFPVLERLVGAEYFRRLALEFLVASPSTHGDLHHIGAPFPDFLGRRFGGTEYEYFADVAALEWAHCEVLVAVDSAPLAADALAAVPPESYTELRFSFAPAARLVRSRYPIVRIWLANQPGVEGDAPIDLGSGGDSLLVCRGSEDVEFHALEPADYRFASSLADGATLGDAFDEAQRCIPTFDPAAALQRLVRLGVLVAVTGI